jgi:hypothetical protein
VIGDLGDAIERVREFFRIGPVTVSEAQVIRSDKMKSIREPGEEDGNPWSKRIVGASFGPASR